MLSPTTLRSGDTSWPVSRLSLSKTASPVRTRPFSDTQNTGTMLVRRAWRRFSPTRVAGFWCLWVTPVSSLPAVHVGDSCFHERTPRTGRRKSENTVPPPIVVFSWDVSPYNPTPQGFPEHIVEFVEGLFRHKRPVIIGPSLDEWIQPMNQVLLRDRFASSDNLSHTTVYSALRVLRRPNQHFPAIRANVKSEVI